MKKILPYTVLLIVMACNDEVPATPPTVDIQTDKRDSIVVNTTDSIETKIDTSSASNAVVVPPPPAAKPMQTPKTKVAAKPKAKIDSIALREAAKLPLDQ